LEVNVEPGESFLPDFMRDAMQKNDVLPSADKLAAKLQAFGDQFEHLATTADQRKLAAQFNAFVGEIKQATLSAGKGTERLSPAPEEESFQKQHGHLTLAGLFAEIRADEEAGKREDAHWYGRDVFEQIRGGKTETPTAEKGKDKDIER
jgi:hypothetical protein